MKTEPLASGASAGAQAALSYLKQIQNASPTTGQTVTMIDDDKDRTLYLTPAGALAALTIAVPTSATSRLGRRISISSTQVVVALTITTSGTIRNGITSLAVNDHITFEEVATNIWIRCLS